jgi:excinuclease UvrABC helicase subunit UvrB
MIPDKLLINLKIISKIQKNGRIARSYDGIISLENDVFYQSIKRFMTSDSRRFTIYLTLNT